MEQREENGLGSDPTLFVARLDNAEKNGTRLAGVGKAEKGDGKWEKERDARRKSETGG